MDVGRLAGTVHGFLACDDCHAAAAEFPHPDDPGRVDCAGCHEEAVDAYARSVHGRLHAEGDVDAPACAACHGPVHALIPSSDEQSPLHSSRLAETCGVCHSDPEMVARHGIPVARPLEAFRASVHARALAAGNGGANCSSCHGTHGILGAADPDSRVHHSRVSRTCGACHTAIAETFEASVHGRAVAHGAREAPSCTDCHGEHRILSPSEPASPVFATNVPKMTCGRCHGDLRLADKYDISPGVVDSYRDSYHGLAVRSGAATVANCASCHGVHDILPSQDPLSHVHPGRLAETCGNCHPGAGSRFAIGPVHASPEGQRHTAVYWVRLFYLGLIFVTVGSMLLHNGLDLYRKARCPHLAQPVVFTRRLRMSLAFRVTHWILIVSFVTLVHSGFALTYPESWWARPWLRWEGSIGLRAIVHRTAAVALLLGVAIHVLHLIVDRRARSCIAAMWPRVTDWNELVERVRWFTGRRKAAPRSAWIGYAEKLEYLALVWGMVIMAVSGVMLWWEELTLRWLPTWAIDVATAVHFYEAVLATLAILVWHFYFVIFDPAVYPMDPAWLTGKSAAGRAAERDPAADDRGNRA